MKGQILDIYPEGSDTFRACVLEVHEGEEDPVRVVCLNTGEITRQGLHACEEPLIVNVFDLVESEEGGANG